MSILESITLDNPCGKDYRYEDEYLNLEVEIEKSFNVAGGIDTDWDIVVSMSEKILQNHSKDIKVAAYWLYGKWKIGGWSLFMDSLDTFAALIQTFGDNLYPQKLQRKIRILEWIENIFEDPLLKALENFSKEECVRVQGLLHKLNSSLQIFDGNTSYILKNVIEVAQLKLDDFERKEEELKKQEELMRREEELRREQEVAQKEAQAIREKEEEGLLSRFSSSKKILSQNELATELPKLENDEFEMTIDSLIDTSKILIENSLIDHRSYYFLFRVGSMMIENALDDTSVIDDDYIPSAGVTEAVRKMVANEHIEVSQLEALAEQLIARPTWLEGFYALSICLYKLNFSQSAEKIEQWIVYFVHRRQELLEFRLGNGTLMISDKFSRWLQIKLLTICGESSGDAVYQKAYQEVLQVKQEQSIANAIELLEENYKKSFSEEERFKWRLYYVEFFLELGDKKLALSLLLELENKIDKYKINEWQPELAVKTYEMLLRPIISQELGSEAKERIYNKLSILDIRKVIS